jgi:hypothetical protein
LNVTGRITAKRIKRGGMWAMRQDRELVALSKTETLEALVEYFKRPPAAILAKAKLGLSIKRKRERKKLDANFRGLARRARSPLLLRRKLQQRHALGWPNPHGTIYVSQHGALATDGRRRINERTTSDRSDTGTTGGYADRSRSTYVLVTAGLKTVGEVHETADETLLSFQDLGPGSIKHLPLR